MTLYGSKTYGQFVYEAAPVPHGLIWSMLVDWNNDGVYDTDEAGWLQYVYVRRGRENTVRKEGTSGVGSQMVGIGEATLYLDNDDGRYDVYNSASELYPNIRPGKKIKLTVSFDGTSNAVITGKIADIVPMNTSPRQIMIRVVDGMQVLTDRDVTVVLDTNRRIDEAIGDVLDAADWPTLWGRALDNTPDYLPYWWADAVNARTLLRDLADASLGQFYVAATGQATFRRRYRADSPVVSLQEVNLGKEISIEQPWDVIFNRITIACRPRAVQSESELWSLVDVPYISAGGTFSVWARFTYNGEYVPALSVVDPVATTDYIANSSKDGSGTDLTSDLNVTITKFAESAKLEFENTGAGGIYLTVARLRGSAIAVLADSQVISENTSSQALYDLRDFKLDNDWLQDVNRTAEFAGYLSTLLPAPSEYPRITLQSQPAYQFSLDLFDLVGLDAPSKYIHNEVLQVGYIEHKWIRTNGQEVTTTLRLEPYTAAGSMWIFPVQLGVSSYLGF